MTEALTAAHLYFLLDAAGNVLPDDCAVGDVTVIQDNTTGIQWGVKFLQDADGEDLYVPHAECAQAATECRLLEGTDWQFPSIQQMRGIEDLDAHGPALKEPFRRFMPKRGWVWTHSTPADPGCSDCAWFVDLGHGHSGICLRGNHGVALVCRPVPVASSPRQ